MVNYYELLEVPQDADEVVLKKAYRKLSLKYHPDRNQEEDAKSRFQAINEAYEVLSDSNKRSQYDMELQFGQGNEFTRMNSMDEFSELNNIFNMMFGGRGGMHGMPGNIRVFHNGPGNFHAEFSNHFHQMQPPPPIRKVVDITIEQLYSGTALPISLERWFIINDKKVSEVININVNIPAGMDDTDGLILKGLGNAHSEDMKGDVIINIRTINNSIFKRQGLDLYLQRKITLKEALCGFSFDIHHLNGKMLCINNTNNHTIIKPGFKKVIQQLGMIKENLVGNLIIDLEIEFPECLTEEQINTLSHVLH
jgi:DnaJ-class molecular chaperone